MMTYGIESVSKHIILIIQYNVIIVIRYKHYTVIRILCTYLFLYSNISFGFY